MQAAITSTIGTKAARKGLAKRTAVAAVCATALAAGWAAMKNVGTPALKQACMGIEDESVRGPLQELIDITFPTGAQSLSIALALVVAGIILTIGAASGMADAPSRKRWCIACAVLPIVSIVVGSVAQYAAAAPDVTAYAFEPEQIQPIALSAAIVATMSVIIARRALKRGYPISSYVALAAVACLGPTGVSLGLAGYVITSFAVATVFAIALLPLFLKVAVGGMWRAL